MRSLTCVSKGKVTHGISSRRVGETKVGVVVACVDCVGKRVLELSEVGAEGAVVEREGKLGQPVTPSL